MKRLVTLLLCAVMMFSTLGCVNVLSSLGEKEDTKWVEEGTAKIGDDITCGQFVMDGVVYEFPMDLQYWLDNGWHVSNNYENKDDFTLEPGSCSTEFELFDADGDYVRVSVLNTSNSDAKIEDCLVSSLYISLQEGQLVFPKGIYSKSKPADVIAAYGEPVSRGDESGYLEALYSYVSDDSWTCYVELGVVDNTYTLEPFSSIEYNIISFDTIWNKMVQEDGEEAATEFYVDATLKTCYWGDTADYVDNCIDSQSGADELYQSEIEYLAACLMYYADVNDDYVTDEQQNRFNEIAKTALSKVKWDVKSVSVNVFNEGTMTIEIHPTNVFDVTYDDLSTAFDNFYTKYADADFESMSDDEYAKVEDEYTTMMLEAMEKNVSKLGTKTAVKKTYDIDLYESVLTDEQWYDIDDVIMDLLEE